MPKKAQASAEYILVSSLILLIILPTVYIFYSYSHKSSEEIRQSQVNKVGTDIVDAAEQVYYLGEPSKTTLDAIMPDGVEKIEIWHNQELVFFLNDGTQIPLKSRVNITTNQNCTDQTERCHYNFKKTLYTQGLKYITIESKGDYVIIGEADLTEVCNGADDDYDDLVDEDFTNENCQPKCVSNGYIWVGIGGNLNCCGNDANEGSPYRSNEKVPDDYCADGNDNDCDGLTDALDPDCFECTPGNTTPCSEQDGVCFGSIETCTGGGTWPGCNYGSDYEDPETSCADSLDNDCDTESDYDDYDGRHGDNNCKVAVTAIAVSDSNPIENTIIEVSCTSSVADVNSIKASIEGATCPWKNWTGDISKFDCNVGGAGTKTVLCSVDTTKSYQSGLNQTAIITVRPSECSAYIDNSNCEADTRCDWCPECSGTEYSGDVSRCVDTGACSYYCWKGKCGALCDETQGPTTQDYYTQSGDELPTGTEQCDLRDYYCTADCGETYTNIFQYSCTTCKYISASSCTGTTLGSCSNYAAGTDTGTCRECDGAGGEQTPSDDSACGTISCDDWHHQVGLDSATGTNYCYDSPDITINRCEGLGDCKDPNTVDCGSADDTLEVSCGVCKYVNGCSGTTDGYCSNYVSSTECSALQDCDYLNNYHITGTQDAASTSYCKYADYNDNYRYCDGAGSCSSLTCSLGSDTTTATAGICQYISGCSGSTPGTVENYPAGTFCGINQICVYTYGLDCVSI